MDDISPLLEQFLSAQKNSSNPYFDVDEIISLINYFLEKDDAVNLKAAIELGSEIHPSNINFKKALCMTLSAIEDFSSAIRLIEEINIKNDKDIDLVRIECYCELNRYNEALDLIDHLTINDSHYLESALIHMACILNDIETYQENAHGFIQHALTLFPDNFSLRTELCFNHELRGNTKEAMDICRELIDEAPYSAEIWYMQGRLYSVCADFEKAIDSLDYAIACIDDDTNELEYEIKIMKAYCLHKNESYDLAISCFKDLRSSDEYISSHIDPYLAKCYMDINEYEEAYKILKGIIGHKDIDDEVSTYGNFIYCCIETERKSEAVDVFADAIKRFPHGILEYISSLNIAKNQQFEVHTGKENIIYPAELARKYISNNIHYN